MENWASALPASKTVGHDDPTALLAASVANGSHVNSPLALRCLSELRTELRNAARSKKLQPLLAASQRKRLLLAQFQMPQ
jgi:hypothetical protein